MGRAVTSQTQSGKPVSSFLLTQFQNESLCEAIQMKMTLICMKMDVRVKHILMNGCA